MNFISNLSPGYIAGVTNPVFEEQHSWWDICINLSTNKMTISNTLLKTVQDTNSDNNQLIPCPDDEILVQEIFEGIKRHIDENYIRQVLYRYVEIFVEMSFRFFPASLSKNVAPYWTNRMEGWVSTSAYKTLQQVVFNS